MRKWYKFAVNPKQFRTVYLLPDQDFADHAAMMGGYEENEAYRSKEDFFNQYVFGYQYRRFEYYNEFLRKSLKKTDQVLSVASGRCAMELFLMEDGYHITCSDLTRFGAYQKTKELFPDFEFLELDVLKDQLPQQNDAVISLSLVCLFDDPDLIRFFCNVSASLKMGGHFILDSTGSTDNLSSHFIHEVFLKYEILLKCAIKTIVKRKPHGLIVKHFGYRRTDEEIKRAAARAGLEFRIKEEYAYTTEFRRSQILNAVIASSPVAERAFAAWGKHFPFIRMFKFQKTREPQ